MPKKRTFTDFTPAADKRDRLTSTDQESREQAIRKLLEDKVDRIAARRSSSGDYTSSYTQSSQPAMSFGEFAADYMRYRNQGMSQEQIANRFASRQRQTQLDQQIEQLNRRAQQTGAMTFDEFAKMFMQGRSMDEIREENQRRTQERQDYLAGVQRNAEQEQQRMLDEYGFESMEELQRAVDNYQAGANAWAEAQGRGLSGEDWYQQSRTSANDLYAQIQRLRDEQTSNAGWATDELSAAQADEQNARLQEQIEELARRYAEAQDTLRYATQYRYADIPTAEDFQTRSAEGRRASDAYTQAAEANYDRRESESRQDMVLSAAAGNPTADLQYLRTLYAADESYHLPTDEWTEEERGIFDYLFAEDRDRALEYAQGINDRRAYQKRQEELARLTENASFGDWLGARALAVLPAGTGEYLNNLLEYQARGTVTQKDFVTLTQFANGIDGKIAEDLNAHGTISEAFPVVGGKGLGDAYQLGMSMIDSAVSVAAGGEAGSLANFFGRAASSSFDEAVERGATPGQALTYGFAAGAAEVFFEKFSVDNIIDMSKTGVGKEFFRNILKSAAIEGSEELATSMANLMSDALIMGQNSEAQQAIMQMVAEGMSYEDAYKKVVLDNFNSLAFDALGGALSGAGHTAMVGAAGAIRSNKYSNAIQKQLTEQGADAATARETAELAVRQAAGEELTAEEQQKLENTRADLRNKGILQVFEADEQSGRSEVKLSEAERQAVTAAFVPGQMSAQEYGLAAREAIQYGRAGESMSHALEMSQFGDKLSATQFRQLWQIGAGLMNEETVTRDQVQDKLSALGKHAAAAAEVYEDGQDADRYAAAMNKAANLAAEGADLKAAVEEFRQNGKTDILTDLTDKQMEAAQRIGAQLRQRRQQETEEREKTFRGLRERAAELQGAALAEVNQGLSEVRSYLTGARQQLRAAMDRAESLEEGSEERAAAEREANAIAADIESTQEIERKLEEEREKARAEQKGKRKKGTVSFDGGTIDGKTYEGVDREKLDRRQKHVVAMVEAIADAVNLDYVFFKGPGNMGGAYVRGGTVYININSGIGMKGYSRAIAGASLSHELTHYLQEFAPKEYAELRDFIVETILKKSPAQFEALVRQQLRWEPKLSYDGAVNELVANACQTMLYRSDAVKKLAREHMSTAEKIVDVIADMSEKIKAAFAEVDIHDGAVFAAARAVEAEFDEISERFDKALLAAGENYDAQKLVERETGETVDNGARAVVQRQAAEIMGKDPATVSREEVKTLLTAAKMGGIKAADYFPVRINTPEALRNFVEHLEKLRGVRSTADITALTTDRPLIMQGKKAVQAMELQESYDGEGEAHEYTEEEILDILEKIDRPRYLVYEESSGNYAIIVNYQSALGDKAIVFFDFNQNKDAPYMSGYKGGTYNTAITVYPNSRPGTINSLLDTKKNKVYDPYGKKGNVQRTSGSLVPSVLNTSPFTTSVTHPTEESKAQNQAWDNSYMQSIDKGDLDAASHMVNQAAKDAGAILNKSGRGALHLYHGTPSFGFTEFRPGMIFLTDNKSIAAGYTANKGYGRPRQISEVYTPDDGSVKTLLKNIKNVLGETYREVNRADVQDIHDSMRKASGEMSDAVNEVWQNDAMDALHEILGDDYTQEFENKLYEILALPGYINEYIDEVFDDPTSETAEDIRRELERHREYYEDVRKVFSEHYKAIKDSAANELRAFFMGYDLTDFLIDAQYGMLKALDAENMLVSAAGTLVSKEGMRERVEQAKDVGAYDLYGFAGDNPLEIDGKGAFWTNIEAPELGGVFMTDEIGRRAKERGYTSVIIHNIMDSSMNEYATNAHSDVYIFFDSAQVKSADPVTYDDNGEVIPLSERFSEKRDIRYQTWENSGYADEYRELTEGKSVDELFSAMQQRGEELRTVRAQLREQKPEYDRRVDEAVTGTSGTLEERVEAFNRWQEESGYANLSNREARLDREYRMLRDAYDKASDARSEAEERAAIEKSGLSEGEYFTKQAVKEFGYTPYYYDAGYITANGKMLNFSGEKGRHFGSRGEDHRAIGTIFATTTQSAAMVRFMGYGNIRIMAESPGIDIASGVEPTAEQYRTIRAFAQSVRDEEYFSVDLTDANGNTVGTLEYDGTIRPDRIVNDIKHYYQTGEIRDAGLSAFYQQWDNDFSYDHLTAKPDMQLTVVDDAPKGKNRADILYNAKSNAAKIGRMDKDAIVYVPVTDIREEVRFTSNRLRHGLDRRIDVNGPVTEKIGEILHNAIRINELNPRDIDNTKNTFVLIGAAKNSAGEPFVVEFIVNKQTNELEEYNILYSMNAKTEPAGIKKEPAGSLSPADLPKVAPLTDSTISIADLLDLVNRYFPDALSEDVLKHFGYDRRPEGKLGERALYQLWDNDTDDTAREAQEREVAYNRLQNENAALHEAVEGLKKLAGRQEGTIARLERRLSLTKTPSVRVSDVQRMAKALVKEYDSKADWISVSKQLKALGDYIVQTPAEQLDEERLKDMARGVAREIAEAAETVTDYSGELETYRNVTQAIKGRKFSIDKAFLGELNGYDAFRKANFGNFTLAQRAKNSRETREGYTSVDQAYIDLQGQFGEGLFPNVANEGEQIQIMADMFERAKGVAVNPFEDYMGETVEYLANKIVFQAMDGVLRPEAPSDADRAKSRQAALKERIAELQQQGKLDAREADRLRQTVYDLTLQLDRAESRYTTLQKGAERRIAQVQNEGRARAAEIKANERAKANEKIAALKEHYQDMARRAREGRTRTVGRTKIRQLVTELNRKLANPTENRYVPRELVQVTIDVLEMIDTDSGRGSEAVAQKLADIRAMYEGYKADPKYQVVYDEVVADMLDNLALTIRGTSLREMNQLQLDAVYQTLKSLNHVISTAVKVKIGTEERNAYEMSREMTQETREIPKAQTGFIRSRYLPSHLRADVMFRRFAGHKKGSTWESVAKLLNDGQLKQTAIKMKLSIPFADLLNDQKALSAFMGVDALGNVRQKDLVDIGLKDNAGQPILVSHDIMVGIYMDLLNEENRRHFIRGGKTIPNLKEFYAGRDGFGAGSRRAVGIAERLSELEGDLAEAKRGKYGGWAEDLQAQLKDLLDEGERYADDVKAAIEAKLTEFDRKWIAATQQLMDHDSKDLLNETTMEVYGIEKARVANYFPITTDPSFLNKPFEEITRDMSLENAGFMKERVKASNPTLAMGTFSVVNRQIDRVAQYCGLMPAIRSFNKIFNKSAPGFADSLKNAVNAKFGKQGMEYLENLIADLSGSRQTNNDTMGVNELLGRLRGNLAQTSLTLNPRVALAQAASYPTAAAELGWKPLAKALARGGKDGRMISRADTEMIAKWSPLLWYRMQGYASVELGDIKNSNRLSSRVWKKLRWATGWIQAVDGATVGRLWYAAEYWVQDHKPGLEKGTDAYYEAVAEKFNAVVEKTQPNYTPMQRATILRDPNALVKTFTMFMTQRLQNFNIIFDSAAAYQKARADFAQSKNGVTREDVSEAKTQMVTAITSQLAQAAVYVGFKLLADMLLHSMKAYRDDDDEITSESVSLKLLDNFIDAMAGSFLFGSELFSILKAMTGQQKWYGLSVNGVDSVNDLIQDLVSLANTKDSSKRAAKVFNVCKSLAQFLGIPLNNAIKLGQAIVYHIEDIANGQFLSFEAGFDRLSGKKLDNWRADLEPLGISQKEYADMLKAADTDGNGSYKQDELGTYLAAALRRGDLTQSQADAVWRATLPTAKKSFDDWRKAN